MAAGSFFVRGLTVASTAQLPRIVLSRDGHARLKMEEVVQEVRRHVLVQRRAEHATSLVLVRCSPSMTERLFSAQEAADRLRISTATLYDWLAQSNAGTLVIRGQPVTIDYFQGGRKGQGRIRIEHREIERLQEAMRVHPSPRRQRRPPVRRQCFPGITVELGDPGD
jgi:hypothetical protein